MGDAIWNKSLILETVGDDEEMMQELIELFFEDTDQRLARLEEALRDDDLEVVRSEAHAIKGASGSFGAERLHEGCGHLERLAMTKDKGEARKVLLLVRSNYEELRSVVVPCP